jgi:hypothetical protein
LVLRESRAKEAYLALLAPKVPKEETAIEERQVQLVSVVCLATLEALGQLDFRDLLGQVVQQDLLESQDLRELVANVGLTVGLVTLAWQGSLEEQATREREVKWVKR